MTRQQIDHFGSPLVLAPESVDGNMQKLIVKLGENVIKEHVVDTEVVTVGRARDNEVVIENLSVSRNHARLRREGGTFVLVDLNSANGTFVNGVRVSKTELVDGDIISVGKHRLHFINTDSAAVQPPTATEGTATGTDPRSAQIAIALAAASSQPSESGAEGDAREIAAAVESRLLIPTLVVTRGKQQGQFFLLKGNETTIGRHGTDIRLHDWNVGKRHAVVLYEKGVFTLRDLGSWQGTILDGEKVKNAPLHPGSEMIFGSTQLSFRLLKPEEIDAMTPQAAADTADFAPAEPPAGQPGLPDTESPRPISSAAETPVPVPGALEDEDDEFSPMTDEELAALENEADILYSQSDEMAHQAEWEQLEGEKLLAEGGGMDMRRSGVLIGRGEEMQREEEALLKPPDAHDLADDARLSSGISVEQEDEEEEAGLFGGSIPDSESALESALPAPERMVAVGKVGSKPATTQSSVATSPSADEIPVPDGVDPAEFRKWSRGLRNRSKIVRREAARKLKDLTGIDYEWESEPE